VDDRGDIRVDSDFCGLDVWLCKGMRKGEGVLDWRNNIGVEDMHAIGGERTTERVCVVVGGAAGVKCIEREQRQRIQKQPVNQRLSFLFL